MSTWVITGSAHHAILWRIERQERGAIVVRRWVNNRKMLMEEETFHDNVWRRMKRHPAPQHRIDQAERYLAYRASL